jgi:hypothetical protein
MKRTISAVFKLLVALTLVAAGSLNALSGGSAPRITTEKLKSMLGDPKLVIVDVRRNLDWNSSEYKIQRLNPGPVASVKTRLSLFTEPDRTNTQAPGWC